MFTTHDPTLLDARLFGRDAIWFVEKDEAGKSSLYSLVQFDRGQLDACSGHLVTGYVQGRFGAVPAIVGALDPYGPAFADAAPRLQALRA